MNSLNAQKIFQSLPILSALIILLFIFSAFSQPRSTQSENGNYALQFDGINDQIDVGFTPILDIISDISICLWYKTESSDWGALVCNYDQYNPDNGYEVCSSSAYDQGGFVYFECAHNDSRDGFSTHDKFNDGKWHFIAAIYTPDGRSRGKVYVDGILRTGYHWSGSEPLRAIGATPAYVFKIGAAYEEAYFKGTIDEVRIWNRALNLQEIQANMYDHLSGTEDGLVGYWPFNEGSGGLVHDFSGNNNHGAISGATWVNAGAPIGTVIILCNPNYGFQNHTLFTSIQGANTHFIDGTQRIWLSKEDATIPAYRHDVHSNTLMDVRFSIPSDAALGQWYLNIETIIDSIISMPVGVEILAPPSVTAQNSNTSSWLKSVYAIDSQTSWAVGNDGSIQKTSDGGVTWQTQTSGISDVLYSVCFTDEHKGWAVGQYGTILKTIDGGTEWNKMNSGTSNNLQAVYFVNASTGWAVGRLGTILKTIDGGVNWAPQNSGTIAWLYSVCFADEQNGWAAGSNGTIVNTSDGGSTWNFQNSGTTQYLSSVYFVDADNGCAVGSNGTILKTTDGGINWLPNNSGVSEWLKSVCSRDGQTGWVVGTNGLSLMTTDGGDTWSTRKSFTTKTLNSVCFADDTYGWAVGETGTILYMSMSNLATTIEYNNVVTSTIPQNYQLFQNYPNPFNPTTQISFTLPKPDFVTLDVFNMIGEKIETILRKDLPSGTYDVQFKGSELPSGIYFYQIKAGKFNAVKKMVLLK